MKWDREYLGHLKTQLCRDIIGLIGMIIIFIIGLVKDITRLSIVGLLAGIFIAYQLLKTIITINKIENGKKK